MGFYGELFISASFVSALISALFYFLASYNEDKPPRYQLLADASSIISLLSIVVASGILIHLLLTQQYNYYYVFNYTSNDLPIRYQISAFYGGQEGSFMLWIAITASIMVGLMRWTKGPLRNAALFFIGLTQVTLLSMILGWDIFGLKIGASPFRTLIEEMPDAPFLRANPGFVPADGKGLNDLLRSPWMMIHPPILFFGFSMMTVPFGFALASLWKKEFFSWVKPAMPWNLASNLFLFIAIFLGGYWAYVTLSFGGFWAWDPVENASLVPWILGVAGIHAMLILKKSDVGHRSAIFLPVLAYVAVVYETFLTRSGVLDNASVHSFVDLGLYNQLLVFIVGVTIMGTGMYVWRFKDLPRQSSETPIVSREFFMVLGILFLSLISLVIIVGTSSPILGRLFVENPTPPEIDFYNRWTAPIAAIITALTALGQYLWWQKHDADSFAKVLLSPLIVSMLSGVALIMYMNIRDFSHMFLVLATMFAVVGNTTLLISLFRKQTKLVGGLISHLGFALLLIGSLFSSVSSTFLLDEETVQYNAAVKQGMVKDKDGFVVREGINMVKLDRNQPKKLGNYLVTYTEMGTQNVDRVGEQVYTLKFEPATQSGYTFYLNPIVYPMSKGQSWGVDPEVAAGLFKDLYVYVAGSAYLDTFDESKSKATLASNPEEGTPLIIKREGKASIGNVSFFFSGFENVEESEQPANSMISVKAHIEVTAANGNKYTIKPLYAIVEEEGQKYGYNTPMLIEDLGITVYFNNVNPNTDEIELIVVGVKGAVSANEDWVLLVIDSKPLISFVWIGVFLIMIGFSIAVMRRWREAKKAEAAYA